ncbi:hypothetical protein TNCT_739301 [Trichonephila clavata]|uniref:Secreted protein n=1 Tax=Trichonephila clavata TaxID=2740835 RepID=A0A8X6FKA9_TRICU|nr:hypothetical protein TNCT_739301 [Trichonephila clavata]
MAGCLTSALCLCSFVYLLQLPSGLIPNAFDKRRTDYLSFHLTRQAFLSSRLRETDEPHSIQVSFGKLSTTPSVRSAS